MANIAEQFLLKFHSLEGITLAQRRKNFFLLLHQNKALEGNAEALDIIAAELKPTTYLESLFKLDLLIYFRRTQELHQLLKEGNDVFVSKIVKQTWFFKDSFNDVGANELVNEILPCMSYTVRMKLLRKLSRYLDDEQFDEIFDALIERYGAFVASHFITGCSPKKIQGFLKDCPITLTNTRLKILLNKDPNLIELYLSDAEHLYDLNNQFYRFVYCENRNLYNSLKEKFKITVTFGRRITKKIVDEAKADILKNPHYYANFLDMKAVVRKIGADSTKLFCNALPSNIEKLFEVQTILAHFPQKYRYKLYVKTVESHYNKRIVDYPNIIDEYILKLIPESAERALLAEAKVNQGHDDYLKYLKIEDAIPRIKKSINLAEYEYQKLNFIDDMMYSCRINNDKNVLADVINYALSHYKNESIYVYRRILQTLQDDCDPRSFSEETWKRINDFVIFDMLRRQDEDIAFDKKRTLPLTVSTNIPISLQHSFLEFLFNKNELTDELLLQHAVARWNFPNYGSHDRKFAKYYLLFAINNSAEIVRRRSNVEDDTIHHYNSSLIKEIHSWNRHYPDDPLSFYDFPSLVATFNYLIRNDSDDYLKFSFVGKIFKEKIFTTTPNDYRDEFLQIYWDRLDVYGTATDFKWFLKYEPLLLAQYFDKFIKKFLEEEKPDLHFWYIVKKFSHLALDDKSTQFCISRLQDDDYLEDKIKLIPCLSVIMTPENFAILADSYRPANKALDLQDEKEVRLYKLQCAIAENFVNTRSCVVFQSLVNYCAGDYLKYALRSLSGILYRTPENQLPGCLHKLAIRAVSVRKHALFFTCELSTPARVEKILKILSEREGVESIQKRMFASTVKYFVKNPSEEFFELVKANIHFIKKVDYESLGEIVDQVQRVPKKFKVPYIQNSWEYFEKTVDFPDRLIKLKEQLLTSLDTEAISEVPLQFGLEIIRKHFLMTDEALVLPQLQHFMFLFATHHHEKTVILEAICDLLDKCENRRQVFEFFRDWYGRILSADVNNIQHFGIFLSFFKRRVRTIEEFYDHVKLFFVETKVAGKMTFDDEFSTRMVTFLNNVIATYGPHVVYLFSSEMKNLMKHYAHDVYHYYYNLISSHSVPQVAILIMELLPILCDEYNINIYRKILQQIENISDFGVQINLNSKFKSQLKKEINALSSS